MNLNCPVRNMRLGLVVCADDFGISTQVNEAVFRLLNNRRISSVSCMVTGPAWEQGAALLKSFHGIADIGLHFVYEGMAIKKVVQLAYTGSIDQKSIVSQLQCQLDSFMKCMGTLPDYIDGHKHVHQLPGFRSALYEFIETAKMDKIYIRNSAPGIIDILKRNVSIFKNLAIAVPGYSLKRELSKKMIPTNNDFLGVYDFYASFNMGDVFEKLLNAVNKPYSILMTHPGCENETADRTSHFDRKRVEELIYLQSDRYKEALERRGLYVTRFANAGGAS